MLDCVGEALIRVRFDPPASTIRNPRPRQRARLTHFQDLLLDGPISGLGFLNQTKAALPVKLMPYRLRVIGSQVVVDALPQLLDLALGAPLAG